jgi:ABC-type transporter MlaC component
MLPTKCLYKSQQLSAWPIIICWWALLCLSITTTNVLVTAKTPAEIGKQIEDDAHKLKKKIEDDQDGFGGLVDTEEETKTLKAAIDAQTVEIVNVAKHIKTELDKAKPGGLLVVVPFSCIL